MNLQGRYRAAGAAKNQQDMGLTKVFFLLAIGKGEGVKKLEKSS